MSASPLVIGLNHATAPVEIREKITFRGYEEGHAARSLFEIPGVEEVMILSTCNRAEIIAVVESPDETAEQVIAVMAELHHVPAAPLLPHLYVRKGEEAVQHLFRVASSLDSMVVGEPQILGQVKEGFRNAVAANTTGPMLSRWLHRAFFSAKRVRTETGIGVAAVSVAYVAVELARKILGELRKKTVLLIGAGEMAELAARHLAGQVESPLIVVNRTLENACRLASRLQGAAMEMERLEDALTHADVVITSTGSCDPVILKPMMKRVMQRRRYRPIFFIDIAIPRDVDPAVNDLDGVYVYNIDDLQAVAEENLGERRQEAMRAEAIVSEEVAKFMKWTESLEAAPTIVAFRDKLEEIRAGELGRLNGKLSGLSEDQRQVVEMLTRSIVNKIAHGPSAFLKRTRPKSRQGVYLDVVQRMFHLDGLQQADAEDVEEES